jgi:hypothetical protein
MTKIKKVRMPWVVKEFAKDEFYSHGRRANGSGGESL